MDLFNSVRCATTSTDSESWDELYESLLHLLLFLAVEKSGMRVKARKNEENARRAKWKENRGENLFIVHRD